MSRPMFCFAMVCTFAFSAAAQGAELWVDNARGDDATADGSPARPFATPQAALKALAGGDTLHLVNTARPYRPPIRIVGDLGGTPERPTVIEGHGSTVSGLVRYGADAWKDLGEGVYRMHLPNNAHVMDGHWRMGFDLVFFDGKPGANCTGREELRPGGYFLRKAEYDRAAKRYPPDHDMLYVKLPAGKTPDEVRIETVSEGPNLFVAADCVVVRDLTSCWTGRDGFSSGGEGNRVRFERVESHHCMDNGISHHGTQVEVVDSHFHHNAGCGIVDVYPQVRVRYLRCLVENDTFRGGVELLSGQFEMIDCIVRNNAATQMKIGRGARVRLANCVIIGRAGQGGAAVTVSDGSALLAERCTVWRAPVAVGVRVGRRDADAPRVTLDRCALLAGETALAWRATRNPRRPELKLGRLLLPAGVRREAGRAYEGRAGWKELDTPLGDWSRAVARPLDLDAAPYAPPAGMGIGATVAPDRAYGPKADKRQGVRPADGGAGIVAGVVERRPAPGQHEARRLLLGRRHLLLTGGGACVVGDRRTAACPPLPSQPGRGGRVFRAAGGAGR